jgi:hypothetical protein
MWLARGGGIFSHGAAAATGGTHTQAKQRVAIDSRFATMFTDDRFKEKQSVDKRGRKITQCDPSPAWLAALARWTIDLRESSTVTVRSLGLGVGHAELLDERGDDGSRGADKQQEEMRKYYKLEGESDEEEEDADVKQGSSEGSDGSDGSSDGGEDEEAEEGEEGAGEDVGDEAIRRYNAMRGITVRAHLFRPHRTSLTRAAHGWRAAACGN